jgi:hypothetical protein
VIQGTVSSSPSSNQIGTQRDVAQQRVTSYDSGYEHSLDRCVDVNLLLQNADEQANEASAVPSIAS